jgi:flagellar hook-basal body complex protein FliE
MRLDTTHPSHLALGKLSGSLPVASAAPLPGDGRFDFFDTLRDAVRDVNAQQNHAQAKVQALQLGQPGVSLEDVIISMQRSGLAFQGMVAVRNKLVEAYREISNMPV